MTGYVLIAVPIVVVENLKYRFGYTYSRSKIWQDDFFWEGALRFSGVITPNVMT